MWWLSFSPAPLLFIFIKVIFKPNTNGFRASLQNKSPVPTASLKRVFVFREEYFYLVDTRGESWLAAEGSKTERYIQDVQAVFG